MPAYHAFVSTIPDGSNTELVKPSDWNAGHVLDVDLATEVNGVLPIANGGTGQTTAADAINALLPSQAGNSGKLLTTDGTNPSWSNSFIPSLTGGNGITYTAGTIDADINTTNLKFTATQINTIQNIDSTATPTFNSTILSSLTSNSIPYVDGSKQLQTSPDLTYTPYAGLATNTAILNNLQLGGSSYAVPFLLDGLDVIKPVATSSVFTYDYTIDVLNVPKLKISKAADDAAIQYTAGSQNWITGIDYIDSAFKISKITELGTDDYLTIDSTGKTTLSSFGVTSFSSYEDSVLKVSGSNVYPGCLISSTYDQAPTGAVYNLSAATTGWNSIFKVMFLDNGSTGGAGDAYYQAAILNSSGSTVTQSYVWGIDNSDDKFKFCTGTAMGSGVVYTIDPATGDLDIGGQFSFDVSEPRFVIGSGVGTTFDGISIGQSGSSDIRIGQDTTHNLVMAWRYNATASSAYSIIENYGGSNPVCMQTSGGGVNIGGVNVVDTGVKLEIASLGALVKSDGSFWVNGASTSAADYARFHQNASLNVAVIDFNSEIWFRPDASTTVLSMKSTGLSVLGGTLDATHVLVAPNSTSQKFKANAYDTYSNRKLKENIVPMPSVTERMRLAEPVMYNFKGFWIDDYIWEEPSQTQGGLISQDFAKLFPDVCSKDATGEYVAIDYGKISAYLIKLWQELDMRIQLLEAVGGLV